MTALAALNIVSASLRTAIVSPWDFQMVCDFEYFPGTPLRLVPLFGGPAPNPPSTQLLACRVNGVDIIDMLSSGQLERLEDSCCEQAEAR